MKRSILSVVFLSFIPLTGLNAAWADDALKPEARARFARIDSIVAAIDGEPLTKSDLERYAQSIGRELPKPLTADTKATLGILQEMISEELMKKEASKLGLSVEENASEAYVEEIKRQNNVNQKEFEALLASRGLTLEEYMKQVQSDIIRNRLVAANVRSKIQVTDEEIERFLEANPDRLPAEGTVHVEQVIVPLAPTASAEEREDAQLKIKSIKSAIDAGAAWREAGREYYVNFGFVDVGDLLPQLRDAITGHEAGTASEIISSAAGYFIVSQSQHDPESDVPEVLKEEVRAELYEQEFRKRLESYLREELPGKYHVEVLI